MFILLLILEKSSYLSLHFSPLSLPLALLSHTPLSCLSYYALPYFKQVFRQIHHYQPIKVGCDMLNIICPDICSYFQLLEKVS